MSDTLLMVCFALCVIVQVGLLVLQERFNRRHLRQVHALTDRLVSSAESHKALLRQFGGAIKLSVSRPTNGGKSHDVYPSGGGVA